jgi:hypothetical protein
VRWGADPGAAGSSCQRRPNLDLKALPRLLTWLSRWFPPPRAAGRLWSGCPGQLADPLRAEHPADDALDPGSSEVVGGPTRRAGDPYDVAAAG